MPEFFHESFSHVAALLVPLQSYKMPRSVFYTNYTMITMILDIINTRVTITLKLLQRLSMADLMKH